MASAALNEPTRERRTRSVFFNGPAIGTEVAPAQAGARLYRALSTLERLRRDSVISSRQAEAGERLRDDYELGVAGARETSGGGGVGWSYPEARLAAVRRYQLAMAELGHLWRFVLPLCVGLPGAGEVSISELARSLGRNRQEIAGLAKFGLDLLADHYRLPEGKP